MSSRKKIEHGERWSLDRVKVSPTNARQHSDEQVRAIAASIKRFGFTMPLLVDENGYTIAGHARAMAARINAMPEVPVIVAIGWTDEEKQAYLIADNALSDRSGWDEALLAAAVEGLEAGGFDVKLLGLSQGDLKRLKASEDDDLTVHEVATSTVRDEFWISIRGPLKYQAEVLKRMREQTVEMENVSVTLGTIGKD